MFLFLIKLNKKNGCTNEWPQRKANNNWENDNNNNFFLFSSFISGHSFLNSSSFIVNSNGPIYFPFDLQLGTIYFILFFPFKS